MKLQITPVNNEAAENGTWTKYRGVRLLIARWNNPAFQRAFRRLTRPYSDLDKIDDETSNQIIAQSVAEGLLLGWEADDWESIIGEKVQYTRANAINLLENDKDCLEFIQQFSKDLNNFLKEDMTELAGKSVKSLSGT